MAIDAERVGVGLADAFFGHEAASNGGIDGGIAYELDGIALAESAYIHGLTTEDILGSGRDPTIKLPIAEEPYPAYRSEAEKSLIASLGAYLAAYPEASDASMIKTLLLN